MTTVGTVRERGAGRRFKHPGMRTDPNIVEPATGFYGPSRAGYGPTARLLSKGTREEGQHFKGEANIPNPLSGRSSGEEAPAEISKNARKRLMKDQRWDDEAEVRPGNC